MRRHEVSPQSLSTGRIARFWLPLEATWLMMAAEGPFLAAVIALLPGALLILLPFLESVLSYYRGVLVKSHRTAPISVAVAAQLAVTTAALHLAENSEN